jgi:hypothetical protein
MPTTVEVEDSMTPPLPRTQASLVSLRRAAVLALMSFLPTACASWRAVPASEVARGKERVDGVELRFRLPGDQARWHLQVERVVLPYVEGVAWTEGPPSPPPPSDPFATGASRAEEAAEARGAGSEAVPPSARRVDLRLLEEVEIYSPGRGVAQVLLITVAAFVLLVATASWTMDFNDQPASAWSPAPRR